MYRGPVCEILISVVLRLDMTIFTYRSAPRAPRAVAAPRDRKAAAGPDPSRTNAAVKDWGSKGQRGRPVQRRR